jgi:hypothetical protein
MGHVDSGIIIFDHLLVAGWTGSTGNSGESISIGVVFSWPELDLQIISPQNL